MFLFVKELRCQFGQGGSAGFLKNYTYLHNVTEAHVKNLLQIRNVLYPLFKFGHTITFVITEAV